MTRSSRSSSRRSSRWSLSAWRTGKLRLFPPFLSLSLLLLGEILLPCSFVSVVCLRCWFLLAHRVNSQREDHLLQLSGPGTSGQRSSDCGKNCWQLLWGAGCNSGVCVAGLECKDYEEEQCEFQRQASGLVVRWRLVFCKLRKVVVVVVQCGILEARWGRARLGFGGVPVVSSVWCV